MVPFIAAMQMGSPYVTRYVPFDSIYSIFDNFLYGIIAPGPRKTKRNLLHELMTTTFGILFLPPKTWQ